MNDNAEFRFVQWSARPGSEARRGYAQPSSDIRRAYLSGSVPPRSMGMVRVTGLFDQVDHMLPLLVG